MSARPIFSMTVFTEGRVEITPHARPKGDMNASVLRVLREVVASMEAGTLTFIPPEHPWVPLDRGNRTRPRRKRA